ncbi:hypothetical protein IAR55_006165 [Kwoniella newhampshirensis]|uniref:Sm domain-containing protein n=1 Tax=Kwoniella newhampshirensis TaxID=1651941 RepID=A0AAW0YU31_9TREE
MTDTLPRTTSNLLRMPHPTASPPAQDKDSGRPSLEVLLNQIVTLTLVDGRVIVGLFTCVDKGCNIILKEAEEFGGGVSMLGETSRQESSEELGSEVGDKNDEVDHDENRADEVGNGNGTKTEKVQDTVTKAEVEPEAETEKDEETELLERLRKNRAEYWPRSEPFGGWGSGFGGRGLGMVGVKGKDVVKIEVGKEVWRGIGGEVDV